MRGCPALEILQSQLAYLAVRVPSFSKQAVIVSETDLMTVIMAMPWDSLLIWILHTVFCWFYMPGGWH